MIITYDDLDDMIQRSRRASGDYPEGALAGKVGWVSHGGQAPNCIWGNLQRIRKVVAGRFDIAYIPWANNLKREEDALFIAHSRQDLLRLLLEKRGELRIELREQEIPYSPAVVFPTAYLRRLKKICDQATPGPWQVDYAKQIDPQIFFQDVSLQIVKLTAGGDVCHVHPAGPGGGRKDALFIAHARWAVPLLATEVLAMRQALDAVRDAEEANGD